MQGSVKWFSLIKGYGFITSSSGEEFFLHKSDVPKGYELKTGQKVEFEKGQTPKGSKAINIKIIGPYL